MIAPNISFAFSQILAFVLTFGVGTQVPGPPDRLPAPCEDPGNALAMRELAYIRTLVSSTDSVDAVGRVAYHLPPLPADSVTHVQDAVLCQQAAAVFGSIVYKTETEPWSGPVILIRVGSTRYVIAEATPSALSGHWGYVKIVSDAQWQPVTIVGA